MDESGLSPLALHRCTDLAVRLPLREAREALAVQGLRICLSQLDRLTAAYTASVQALSEAELARLADQALERGPVNAKDSSPAVSVLQPRVPEPRVPEPRVMVAQVDGCFVLERDKPLPGQCEGREVKHALFYPLSSPGQRVDYAAPVPVAEFIGLAHGLMRHAHVRLTDRLIGVGDGAEWVDQVFESLGVRDRILDVYHAVEYLERVGAAGGWDQHKRTEERRRWCRGEVNARGWLEERAGDGAWDEQVRSNWSTAARQDWAYLVKHAARGEMEYLDFKGRGWPIGSGQIEGANKSVIGSRMKRSGMRWSRAGLARMAAARCAQRSVRALVSFEQARTNAFHPN